MWYHAESVGLGLKMGLIPSVEPCTSRVTLPLDVLMYQSWLSICLPYPKGVWRSVKGFTGNIIHKAADLLLDPEGKPEAEPLRPFDTFAKSKTLREVPLCGNETSA